MNKNKLIVAAAWSGKTNTIIERALAITDKENVLITTFTDANADEIRRRILKRNKGCVPSNITIQPWFSFLLQHWVRPYQDLMLDELSGRAIWFYLIEWSSARREWQNGKPYFVAEKNFYQYYFSSKNALKMHSDKVAEFACKCNTKTSWAVIDRISRIYPHIFIDEVQDLAGFDLELLKLLFDSRSHILLVWDPRQATYSTHNAKKHSGFKKDEIINFFSHKDIRDKLEIDFTSLSVNHRCNQFICDLSNKIYPSMAQVNSAQNLSTGHDGIFLIRKQDLKAYLEQYHDTVQLRYNSVTKGIIEKYRVMNFWASKGLTFERVLIFPTESITEWMKDNQKALQPTIRSKLYVALTRARHSAAIVYDYTESDLIEGTEKYTPGI